MAESTRRGQLRQQLAEKKNLRPVMAGSTGHNIRGCQLEQAVAKYLGEELGGWDLDSDRARGCDLGTGWHVRGSFYGDWFLLRGWDKATGTWVFGETRSAPRILLHGWLSGEECASAAVSRPGKPHKWIRRQSLHPLPRWLYVDSEPACQSVSSVRGLQAALRG